LIKCVIWDLDNTLFRGVYLETPDQRPPVDPAAITVLHELSGRGILQAIASRNPREAASYATELTGHSFASVQCGWGAKSAAVSAVLTELGLVPAEAAFIDDDAMERAEVSFRLPDVLVLDPRDLADVPSWPQFSPPVVTEEGRRRGELYLQRQARQQEAKTFGGSVEEFLRQAGTQVRIAPASQHDTPRLAELSVRTHQFNSAGQEVSQGTFADLLEQVGQRVITVRLSDKFGDDGLVGGCIITTKPPATPTANPPAKPTTEPATSSTWRVPLLMMSCRAIGRGVIDALLTWICLTARGEDAAAVIVPCVINDRNVPLRIALTGAGFRAGDPPPPGQDRSVDYVRPLTQPLPALPDWVVTG
jgi:methoxymalonate biosynthesis protein